MVLPKGLAGVLAGEALDDAGAAGVLVDKVCEVREMSASILFVFFFFFFADSI